MAVVCGVLLKSGGSLKPDTFLNHMTKELSQTPLEESRSLLSENISVSVFEHPNLLKISAGVKPVKAGDIQLFGDLSLYNGDELSPITAKLKIDDFSSSPHGLSLVGELLNGKGPDEIGRVEGDFCLFAYNDVEGSIIFFRDIIGHKSVYYTQNSAGLFFASIPQPLFSIPQFTPKLSIERLAASYCLGHPGKGHTLHPQVKEVETATWIKFTADRSIEKRKYWVAKPDPDVPVGKASQVYEYVRTKLHNAVEKRIPKNVSKIGLELSGGLDSSVIAGLLCQKKRTFALNAVSYVLKKSEEGSAGDESQYIRNTLSVWPQIQWHPVRQDTLDILDAGHDWNKWFMRPSPDITYCIDHAFNSLQQGIGSTVVFTGFGGDDVVSAPGSSALVDFAKSLDLRRFISEITRLRRRYSRSSWMRFIASRIISPLFPNTWRHCYQLLRGNNWFKALGLNADLQHNQEFKSILKNNGFDPYEFSKNSFYALEMNALSQFDLFNFPAYDFFANLRGHKFRHPLLDRNLIEAVLAIPSKYKISQSQDRLLLRHSCKDIVADEILERDDKSPFFPDMEQVVCANQNQINSDFNRSNGNEYKNTIFDETLFSNSVSETKDDWVHLQKIIANYETERFLKGPHRFRG